MPRHTAAPPFTGGAADSVTEVSHNFCGQVCEWAREQAAKSAPGKGFHGVLKEQATRPKITFFDSCHRFPEKRKHHFSIEKQRHTSIQIAVHVPPAPVLLHEAAALLQSVAAPGQAGAGHKADLAMRGVWLTHPLDVQAQP